jgi:PadR family transcriptional regulator, regulatory protein PadR
MATRRPSPQTMAVLLQLGEQASGWSYGYDLCRTLGLKPGTVYPILIRLAERGMVETAWEQAAPQGRPARHLYRLSSAGTAFLAGLRTTRAAAAKDVTSTAVSTRQPAIRPAGA